MRRTPGQRKIDRPTVLTLDHAPDVTHTPPVTDAEIKFAKTLRDNVAELLGDDNYLAVGLKIWHSYRLCLEGDTMIDVMAEIRLMGIPTSAELATFSIG